MKKKFGKNISRLLYTENRAERSRFNTSGITVTETVTGNDTNKPICSIKDLPKMKKETFKGEE